MRLTRSRLHRLERGEPFLYPAGTIRKAQGTARDGCDARESKCAGRAGAAGIGVARSAHAAQRQTRSPDITWFFRGAAHRHWVRSQLFVIKLALAR